jgi:ABC-type uncharacterized transport system involved in gliding motility auxiliary subunit
MRRELGAYFGSPVAYAVLAVFLAITGYFFFSIVGYYSLASVASLQGGSPSSELNLLEGITRPFFSNVAILLLFVLPMVSMRLFSEEMKSGTFELLFSYPVQSGEAVMGKFGAAVGFLALLLAGALVDIALTRTVASADAAPWLTAYLGLLLLGGAYLSLGIFVSAITPNQIVAAVVSFGALVVFALMEWGAQYAGPGAAAVLRHFSMIEHFGDFAKGVIDAKHVAFFGAFALFFLFAAACVLEARRGRPLASAALSAAALGGILVIAYLFIARTPMRFDFTRDRRFGLTAETERILSTLPSDIEVFSFYREGDDARISMKDLLDEYVSRSKRFRYLFVDPDRSPGLAKENGVHSYGTTVVRAGARRATIFTASESQITSAIVRVTRESARTIGVATGHGEAAIGSTEKEGLSELRDALDKSRVGVREVFLAREPLDRDALAAVLIAGPAKDLLPEERAALHGYLDAGGGLVALIDPGEFPELESLLAEEGIGLGDEIVVDRLSQVFGADNLVPVVSSYPASAITRDFRLATFFPIARPVSLLEAAPPGAEGEEAVLTGPGSWAESDVTHLLEDRKAAQDPAADRAGPIAIAVLRERPAATTHARIAVFGDSDFASNANFLRSGNGDLLQNAIAWAMGDEAPVSVRPRDFAAEPVVLSSRQGALLFWVPVVAIPAVAAALGAIVVVRRRS